MRDLDRSLVEILRASLIGIGVIVGYSGGGRSSLFPSPSKKPETKGDTDNG